MAASFVTEPDLRIGKPRKLFEDRYYRPPAHPQGVAYDIAPDGRFLMIEEGEPLEPMSIQVLVNWTEELKYLAPAEN